MAATQQKIRNIVWTGGIAMVTATGAWYGAGLKMKGEMKKEIKKRQEASPADKIAQLEEQRGGLIAKRIGLERKIEELERRARGMTREESLRGQERRRPWER